MLIVAHRAGRSCLPDYSHRSSPKKFTQPQLFACLVLKEFLQLDYRKLAAVLGDAPELAAAIELKAVPHFTTFQKAADRLLLSPRVHRLLDETLRLAHPLDLSSGETAAFTAIFADYEIAQPFAQLGRESYRLSDDERAATALARYAGRKVAIGSLVGLQGRGWRKDELTTESGRFAEAIRVLEDGARVRLPFTPGAWIGDVKSEPVQTLEALELEGLESWGAVDPVLVSEILRDIERMAEVR